MRHHGLELVSESSFLDSPRVGRIMFVDKRVYIAVELTGSPSMPVWVPMTNEIEMYVHAQTSASTTWTVVHNLNAGAPIVQVYDDNHNMVIPNMVIPIDQNTVQIGMEVSVSGTAVVLVGETTQGTDRSDIDYNYTHVQSSASMTWTMPHNLGYYPIVRVFVGGEEIQPRIIKHNSIMVTTITFSSAQSGFARAV